MPRFSLVLCLLWLMGVTTLSAIPDADNGVSAARVIRLAITPPGKDAPTAQCATHENEAVTIAVPNLGSFAFSPAISTDNRTVAVTIYDNRHDGHTRLGEVQAPIGGKAVQSKTEPSFGIRIASVSAGASTQATR